MPEPTQAGQPSVRWIDSADGHHKLVLGPELLPLARVILACGDISSEDQDRIAASWNACRDLTLEQIEAVRRLLAWFRVPSWVGEPEDEQAWPKEWDDFARLFPWRPT